VGLVTFDSYLGGMYGAYVLVTGRHISYQESYGSLIAKIFRAPKTPEIGHGEGGGKGEGGEYDVVSTEEQVIHARVENKA